MNRHDYAVQLRADLEAQGKRSQANDVYRAYSQTDFTPARYTDAALDAALRRGVPFRGHIVPLDPATLRAGLLPYMTPEQINVQLSAMVADGSPRYAPTSPIASRPVQSTMSGADAELYVEMNGRSVAIDLAKLRRDLRAVGLSDDDIDRQITRMQVQG